MTTKITVQDEVLFRHIHPNSMDQGEPASDRFRPSANDLNKLSVDRSSKTTAADALALYTSTGRKAVAVFGITVGEFGEEKVDCVEDPVVKTEDEPENPAHALGDYSPHELKEQKNIAKRLKRKAVARGACYEAPAQSGRE